MAKTTRSLGRGESSSGPEEEFFCLTPEDARSLGSSERSRHASGVKPAAQNVHVPDSKIFSVAVEARSAEQPGSDSLVVCDIDTDYTGRFAVVSSNYNKKPVKHEPPVATVKEEEPQVTPPPPTIVEQPPKPGKKGKKKKKKGSQSESSCVSSSAEEGNLKKAESREVSPKLEDDMINLMLDSEPPSALAAECLIADDLVKAKKEEEPLVLMGEDEPQEEEFSSAFINTTKDEDDEEEPFVIREPSPDFSEKDEKSIDEPSVEEEPPPSVNPEATGRPIEALEDDCNDIINKIKLAEKIYDTTDAENDEEELRTKKSDQDTSEDDLEFQPAISRRQKRKNKQKEETLSRRASGASFADSESSLVDEQESREEEVKKKQEGWSFEADDLDVNLLLQQTLQNSLNAEEKTSLDEVFKFDSELAAAETGVKKVDVMAKNDDGWNDLDDALSADENKVTEDDSDNNKTAWKSMSTSYNVKMEDSKTSESENELRQRKGLSQSYCSTSGLTTESESSVGNSPNPRKTTKKSKKSKKKRF